MSRSLDGTVALVTGAASGIGRACAASFVAAGATVMAVDIAETTDEVAADIGAVPHRLDVADPHGWDALAARVRNELGRLDIAVLNAGIRLGAGDVTALDVTDYLRLIGINQHGVVFGLRSLIPVMEPTGGDVVVIASRAGVWPLPNDLPYAMAKHAVVGLVRSVAPDLEQRGIRINALAPGTVDTGFLGGAREQLEAAGIAVMDSAEVADGVLHVIAGGGTGEILLQPSGEPPTKVELPEADR